MNDRNIIGIVGGGLHCRIFHEVVSVANLFAAWNEFKKGKRKKRDVALFELHLENNIFALHRVLTNKTFFHEPYTDFYVCDPKRRHIHKASVRDRVLHQAIFRVLYPVFDKHFIFDSYSSRLNKGTHAGVARLKDACCKVSRNWKSSAWVLKCDVRKFFDSIDHGILRSLINEKVDDMELLALLDILFASFENTKGKGLPLGNVTSQLFANIYLNELDQFIKHELKARHYFRYCDDFVIVHADQTFLETAENRIAQFLQEKLLLHLHPYKVEIRKVRQGIDFLGYVVLPHHIVLRTKTKKRMLRNLWNGLQHITSGEIDKSQLSATLHAYLGILSHANANHLTNNLKHKFRFLLKE